jgi:PAS domain S-box-containing protein
MTDTDHRRVEEALRESLARLQVEFDRAPIAISEVDAETGALLRANDRYCEMLGSDRAELLGRSFFDYTHPDDRARNAAEFQRLLRGEAASFRLEKRFLRKDGSPVWVDMSAFIVRDESGAPMFTVGFAIDISERKRAEAALRESLARLQVEFDQAPIGISEVDARTGILVRVNDAYTRIYGHKREDLVGRPFLELTHPDDRTRNLDQYQRLQRGELTSYSIEKRVVRKDGTAVWVNLSAFAALDEGGRPLFTVGMAQDITERKRTEAALRHSEERFRSMLESLPHIAFIQRPDGTAQYHNRRFFDYVGREGRLGHDMASRLVFHHPDDIPMVMEMRGRARTEGVEYSYEARLRRHDGVFRWHIVDCKPLRRDGEVVAWLGTAVDIDDIRRANELLEQRVEERTRELAAANDRLVAEMADRQAAEQQLRQSEKLNAIGQLTGGVAHDFNNVLAAVLGNLELVERRLTDERLRRMVQAASRAAQRGAKLTEQLLAFARKQQLAPEPVDLNRMFGGEMSEMLARTLGHGIDIQTALAPDLWTALVDPTQIELVVLNLAINARDAMPQGGTILIETRNAPRDSDLPPELSPGDYVMVAVSDTGTGMSDEVAARAFEPFFTTKEPGKGSGLGLSQVYGFARQLGGAVRLKTELGQGTRVELFLPRTEAKVEIADDGPAAEAPAGTRSLTILIVDDQDDVRDVAVAHVEALGYRAVATASGQLALDLLEGNSAIDLLLADYAMPGMSGIELALAAVTRRPSLPIVIVTGYADVDGIERQIRGAQLLKKPYRLHELAERIEAALARRSAARAVRA